MKIAIIIPVYNRPQYLERCLASLKRSNLMGAEVIIYDDASTDAKTLELIKPYRTITSFDNNTGRRVNVGVCKALLNTISQLFEEKYDVVINLDSDAIVRNDWMQVLLNLHDRFTKQIITGFHSTTKNKDGSERHKMISGGNGFCEKLSVGGINMLFSRETFERYAKPALEKCIAHGGNWDHMTCINAGSVICAVPSVVQHIGIESSLGHTHDKPDVADDFKMLSLPNVTLVCVDDDKQRACEAIKKSFDNISFGDIQVLSSEVITKLGSKEAYSKFILTELHKYIDTDYALIIQHDGYVKNPEAWTDEFLKYDYIGAPWWYKDGMNVGNGGFSLRSKKLLQLTSQMNFTVTHPEDHVICRTYRKQLESHGITFAPENLAHKFSFEGYNQAGTWNGQFGFHGERALRTSPNPIKPGFIINQFFGLGDILFLVPLIRKWMAQGHDIIWPIADQYFGIKHNFPDIQFVKKSAFPMQYDSRIEYMHRFRYGIYKVKQLRWNMCNDVADCMTTKYTMYNEDWQMWRELKWERDTYKERELAAAVGAKGEYELHFRRFGSIPDGPCTRDVGTSKMKVIEVEELPGFTLLDWALVIENAAAIHAVSSACVYLFEMLNLRCEPTLYARKRGRQDFVYIQKLLTKKYKYSE